MDSIRITDCTLRQPGEQLALSFREKLELCKLIDRLNVSMIELNAIEQTRVDSLLIKSVCSAVQNAGVAVPVHLNAESVRLTWEALKEGRKVRLQVFAPVSSVQMEYLLHKKPVGLQKAVEETIRECVKYTDDVEFIAGDATRSDASFLRQITAAAISAGAKTVTLCDTAGTMLPEEMGVFLESLLKDVPSLSQVTLGFSGANHLSLADACAVVAVRSGAREIKAASFRIDQVSLPHLATILDSRGAMLNVHCGINMQELHRITSQIKTLCRTAGDRSLPLKREPGLQGGDELLSAHDSRNAVAAACVRLGYDLSAEDLDRVWEVFRATVEKKERLTLQELDAIIAAEAMQVPPVYTDVNYVINTGSAVGAMAHMKLRFHDRDLEGISTGDGVIDAAFQSIEKAINRHFELDDFQIQAVSEGHEAMGETLVRLRSDGKLYSGRGISTDIVGASIMAYINALNKIAYEEEEV